MKHALSVVVAVAVLIFATLWSENTSAQVQQTITHKREAKLEEVGQANITCTQLRGSSGTLVMRVSSSEMAPLLDEQRVTRCMQQVIQLPFETYAETGSFGEIKMWHARGHTVACSITEYVSAKTQSYAITFSSPTNKQFVAACFLVVQEQQVAAKKPDQEKLPPLKKESPAPIPVKRDLSTERRI
jgi:hypothetical protein